MCVFVGVYVYVCMCMCGDFKILKTLKEKIRSKAKAKLVKKARRVQQRRVKVEMEEENLLLVQTE